MGHLKQVFKSQKWFKITDSFQYYCQDVNEMNVLLMMERRLACHIISLLNEKLENSSKENEKLEQRLNLTEQKWNELREKWKILKHEGNTLKRYNSKLVFNSFVSDLTDVPRKDAKSQARVRQMLRDISASNSMKKMMFDVSADKPSSNLKIFRQSCHEDSCGRTPASRDNSISDFNHIEVSNQLK